MGCTTSQVSDSMSVKLAVDMRSQPCRALAIFLKLTGIPHQLQNVDIFKGEHKTPSYTAKFPLNTVPGLADGDFYLGETVAIFRYLVTTYESKIQYHWYPKDLKARARVDAYLSFHHTGTRAKCIKVFINEVLGPMHGKPVDEECLKKDLESLSQCLDLIEKSFLKDSKFLCGNEISIADLMAVCEFSQFIVNGRDIFEGKPKLKAYFDRVKACLNPAFDQIHSVIYALRDSMKKSQKPSTTPKLMIDRRSQPCRALAMFLKLSGIPHQLQDVDIFKGEHKTPEYTAKFPLNTVPGLEDGDFCLGETVAIFRYLVKTYGSKIEDHWYPKDLKARARVDAYMSFHHTGTRSKCIKVFINEVLGPMHGKPVDEESLKKDLESLSQCLDLIEKSFLKDTDYLCGNEISIADLMAVCEFSQFLVNSRDISVGHPKINAYYYRVKARLEPAFDDIHSMIYSLRDKMKESQKQSTQQPSSKPAPSQTPVGQKPKLVVDMRSQPCRSLAMFLKQTGIPHELQNVDIFKGEHKTPEYTAKFPLNTVPGLEDGDFCLGETVAIFRYLVTTYGSKIEDHWYPKDLKARARVDAYMSFHHTGTRSKCIKVFINEVLGPMHGKPVDEESLKKDLESLSQCLDLIEKSFLKDTDYLCGNEISIADLMAVCEFSQFIVNGRDICEGKPKLKSYFDRVKTCCSPAFDDIHAAIYSLRDSMKK